MKSSHWFKSLTLAVAAVALAWTTTAKADIYLEPYLGYLAGKWEMGASNKKMHGTQLGARVGYSMLGFAVGAEYEMGIQKDDASPSNDLTPGHLGAFASYEFPILVRVYGTLYPMAKTKSKSSTATTTYEGKGVKLGVGFTPLPLLAVNFEMQTHTFDKNSAGSLTDEMKMTVYGVNVSLPLNL